MRRDDQSGVILINVLVILALASAVLVGMIRVADLAISRSQTFADAARAEALIAGGEASAIAVLQRDMTKAPSTDNLTENWAAIAQAETAVEGGSFSLTIADAQRRFDLNSLRDAGGIAPQILTRIAVRLGLPEDAVPRILARMAAPAPLRRIDDLVADAGLATDQVTALQKVVTLLPVRADVNINTAPDDLLFALSDNPVQARGLIALRRLKGALTSVDMAAVQLVLLPGTGYTSRLFEVAVTVRIGEVRISSTSLLLRRIGAAGRPEVVVIERRRGTGGI